MLRLSTRTGVFDRFRRVLTPRSESSVNSLIRTSQIHSLRGPVDLESRSYPRTNAPGTTSISSVPQENLITKVKGYISTPYAMNFSNHIHSSSQKDYESRSSRQVSFVRGFGERDGRNSTSRIGDSRFGEYGVENNADIVHIKMMRNNTFVTVTDSKGNKKIGASSGCLSGSKKISRYAGDATAEHVGRIARNMGLKSVVVKVNGQTFFKKKRQAILGFREGYTFSKSDGNPIVYIEDTTRKPHNGCRLRKQRRV